MLDGLVWAAGEIVLFMLLATLLGFGIAFVFLRWVREDSTARRYETELSAQIARVRKAEHRLDERQQTVEMLQRDLRLEVERVGELEAQLEASQASLDDMVGSDTNLDANRAEIRRLTARVRELEQAAAQKGDRVTVNRSEAANQAGPTREESLERMAAIAARTAGDAPVADDDLKKVRGIGPKLEQTLKGLGITSFRQIANFTADDIAHVTAALGAFKGRIERDDWMGGAAAEHLEKYNEPV